VKKPTVPASNELSPGLRRYFYFTASVTGAAIMIVEILGAKMLSPYVGTSHFVWTAQIAVTLIALALGYYAGGLVVDRSPKVSLLYWAILLAALYLTFTVVACEPVAYSCLESETVRARFSARVNGSVFRSARAPRNGRAVLRAPAHVDR
jgi:hypothetical protein